MILSPLKAEGTELNCLPKPAVTLESRSSKALQAGRRMTYDGYGAIKSKHLVGSGWSLFCLISIFWRQSRLALNSQCTWGLCLLLLLLYLPSSEIAGMYQDAGLVISFLSNHFPELELRQPREVPCLQEGLIVHTFCSRSNPSV